MSDLINRESAIVRACAAIKDDYVAYDVVQALKAMPSAQPEIIRCRDCRFYEWMSNRVPEEQTWYCHNWNAETGKDDYCSYAERRQDDSNY